MHFTSSFSTFLKHGINIVVTLACITAHAAVAQAPFSMATPNGNGYLILSGYLDTQTGVVSLPVAFMQDRPNDAPPNTTGLCVAELFDGTATLLASAHFTPGLTLLMQEPAIQSQPDSTTTPVSQPASNLQEFSASLPWHPASQRLQIRCAGKQVYTLRRSSQPPVVRLDHANSAQQRVRGLISLTWRVTPGNAPVLGTQVQFSSDYGQRWVPLSPFTPDAPLSNMLQIDTTLLPSGRGHWLRVLASDGLNTVYATRTLTIANPLKIASTAPMAEATEVSPFAPIEVQFVSPIATAALQTNPLSLLNAQGQTLTGAFTYLAETQILRFKPNLPLQAGQRYQARLAAALRDTTGNALASLYTWSFTTAKASP